MTEPSDPTPIDPLDELASAHLDGLTTEDEAAQVAGDPALAARVEALAAARDAVRAEGPPVDEARREAAIAAALAAFDDEATGAPAAGDRDGVTPIAVAAARRHTSRRSVQLIGAVAVAVLLALAVPLLGVFDPGTGSDEDVATSALEESAADDQVAAERDGGDAAGGAAPDQAPSVAETYTSPASAPVELGTFDDVDALAAAVAGYVAPQPATSDGLGTASTTTRAAEDANACPDEATARATVLAGTATLDGRPVLVRVHERADGKRDLVVVDAADCSVVATRPLP